MGEAPVQDRQTEDQALVGVENLVPREVSRVRAREVSRVRARP